MRMWHEHFSHKDMNLEELTLASSPIRKHARYRKSSNSKAVQK
jgi:hypothetical protein